MSKNVLKENAAAFALYLGLTLAVFWPCLSSFSTALIGPPEDNMQFYWFLWNGHRTLATGGGSFLHTNLMYYPEGASLLYANYYYYGVFLTLVLKPLMSLAAVFNFLVMHSFVLAAFFAFILIRYLSGDFWASLAGGLIFGFNPSHFAHSLHHVTIASIQFIPLFVYFTVRIVRGSFRWRWALSGGLCLALSALCDWNYLVYGTVFLGCYYVYLAATGKTLWHSQAVFKLGAVLAAAALMLSPLLVPMVWVGLHARFLRDLPGYDIYVADLIGFFVPDSFGWANRFRWVSAVNGGFSGNAWESAVYLGWANLLILALAFKKNFRTLGGYWLGLLVFMLLAMGSTLRVFGKDTGIILPYKLFEFIPLAANARNPSRIMVYAYLFLSILAAFSLKSLLGGPALKKRIARAAAMAAIFLIAVDFFRVAKATTPVVLPAVYRVVQADPDRDFAILEIPWDGPRYLLAQTQHGIACVQGYLGRRLESTLGDRLSYNLKDLPAQKATLIDYKVKYILLHKKRLDWEGSRARDVIYSSTLERVSKVYSQIYPTVYEDDRAAVFKVYG